MSLPSWERGLKWYYRYDENGSIESLPSWERGLKYVNYQKNHIHSTSLPSWERGLKYNKHGSKEVSRPRRSPRGSVD